MRVGMRWACPPRRCVAVSVAALIALAWAATTGAQQRAAPQPAARRPAAAVTFTERSPLSDPDQLLPRLGWSERQRSAEAQYDLTRETFATHIPPTYDGTSAFGLLVWVSPAPVAAVPSQLIAALDRHQIIAVSAGNSGNERAAWVRVGLALDAVHNMSARYRIDPQRIYVAGFSGGGRISSISAMGFPDVFSGAICVCGCDFYRQLPTGRRPNEAWRATFVPAQGRLLAGAKKTHRFVLITGEGDGNRDQTHAIYEAMRHDRFEHVSYDEVPGMGHTMPGFDRFGNAIALVDTVPVAPAPPEAAAPSAGVAAVPPTQPAAQDPAEQALRVARLYVDQGLVPQARQRLEAIIAQYPGTAAANEAARLLRSLGRPEANR